ncbi:MAG: hypothetical protein ACK5DE_10470 [Bacteroidota bacterium]|jgi:hypothetical protein
MAHYAKVENGIVTQVIVADSIVWCEETLGGEWVQTSYNTSGGVHSGGKFPIHKNYAGIGHHFDGIGFYAPQPYASWTLNSNSYLWEAPIPMPTDGKLYEWNEDTQEWVEIPVSE